MITQRLSFAQACEDGCATAQQPAHPINPSKDTMALIQFPARRSACPLRVAGVAADLVSGLLQGVFHEGAPPGALVSEWSSA